jgi:dTDP-4-amino-4,6-dideoxygalactose transaminase
MKIALSKPSITKKELQLISNSLKSNWLTHGPNNIKFENQFSKTVGAKYAVSMNSCTSALECALKLLKKKGEVIIPSWTWVSTGNVVLNTGNTPVFADVQINSRNLTADLIKKRITKKTVAVIVVHYAGLMCKMDEIKKLTDKAKILLVEDSAECLGGTFENKFSGSFGVGCFSFFPTKNITTTEGGMLTTNSKREFDHVKKLIAHGIDKSLKKKPWHRIASIAGHNYRMPNHLAALGVSQLRKLKKFNSERQLIAKKYNNFFQNYPNVFKTQTLDKRFFHSYQMYSVLVKKELRDNLIKYLIKNKIEASCHFDPPLHKQKYLNKYNRFKLKNTEYLSKTIVTLPIYPGLKVSELNYMFIKIKKWLKIKNKL